MCGRRGRARPGSPRSCTRAGSRSTSDLAATGSARAPATSSRSQPRNVSGSTMTPNSIGTVRGSKRVPNVSPSAADHEAGQRHEREQHRPVRCRGSPASRARSPRSGTRSAPRDRPLRHRAGGDLLDRDERDRHRREDAVLDLARVAELLHHRAATPTGCPGTGSTSATTPATRSVENDPVGAGAAAADALPDLREHVREHEDEQQRLEDRARDELAQVLAE